VLCAETVEKEQGKNNFPLDRPFHIRKLENAGQGAGKESRRERGGGARLRGSPGNRCPNPAHAVGFYQRR